MQAKHANITENGYAACKVRFIAFLAGYDAIHTY